MAKEFFIAKNPTEAVKLAKEKGAFLAGGTEINRLDSSVKAQKLVSIRKLGFDKIEKVQMEYGDRKKQDFIKIGSCCTFQKILENPDVPFYLKEAIQFMASRTKRNMATIGGNLALLRDDSYLCATLLASKAKVEFNTGKIISIEDYVFDNSKYAEKLISAIYVIKGRRSVVSKRYANTAESHSVLTVSVGYEKKIGYSIYAAVKNCGIIRPLEVEKLINDKFTKENEILEAVNNDQGLKFKDDMFGSENYKKYLLGVTIASLVKKVKEVEA